MQEYNLYQLIKAENDFQPIIKTAVGECCVKSEQTARKLLDAFLQWFSLIPMLKETEKLQMIRGVDPIWHAFVLHTKFYREFCDKYIGYFVDHDPTDLDIETSKELYAEFTLKLLHDVYGENVNEKLLALAQGATCCCQCRKPPSIKVELEEFALS